jgi:hypothetical protein
LSLRFLAIRLLVAEEDRRNLYQALAMKGNKNEAIPADALAVPPLPLFAPEGLYVALEWVCLHPVNGPSDQDLLMAGEGAELPRGRGGEFNRP